MNTKQRIEQFRKKWMEDEMKEKKVWEEDWQAIGAGFLTKDGCWFTFEPDDDLDPIDRHDALEVARIRARLAAQAPRMARMIQELLEACADHQRLYEIGLDEEAQQILRDAGVIE